MQFTPPIIDNWMSTRRPIAAEAVVANVDQLTIGVVTQGGQVKIIANISSRGNARVDSTTVVFVRIPARERCTQIH